MARLTVEQMIDYCEQIGKYGSISKAGLGSEKQVRDFEQYVEGGKVAPNYIINFFDELENFDQDIEAFKQSLADEEKPLTGGSLTLQENEKIHGKTFVFTSAQNNTEIHSLFFDSIKKFCKHNDAQLIIGQFVYNKNGFQNGTLDKDDIYFAQELSDYFLTNQVDICANLTWCGDVNILPTAKNPITGFETLTGTKSSILPHAKIALESIASPKREQCKMIYTTGTITQHNYIAKKAGQIAEKAHCYGALIIEIDESGQWFARQIQTDESGEFYDLDKLYTPERVLKGQKPRGINWGDIHAEKSDFDVRACMLQLRDELKPENQVLHDLSDFTARNHHNRQSGHFLAEKHFSNNESVYNNLLDVHQFLKDFCSNKIQTHVIESNHDLALESWLNCNHYDFKKDPVNSITYLELNTAIYKSLKEGAKINVLKYALTDYLKTNYKNVLFYEVDASLLMAGIECANHGHVGANGSRGNPNQFVKFARPMNLGHTHSCSIKGQIYTAGISGNMEQEYNKGHSSWSHSHILTYPNGFRSIITMKKDDTGVYKYKA